MNKAKLLKLRNDLNRYLEKHDTTEKVMVLDKEINSFTSQVVEGAVRELGSKIDFGLSSKDISSPELLQAIQDLGDRLSKSLSTVTPIDRTDEVITAISGIRFPEINLPDHISVDNFPPQHIPQPVTNIKATVVADDTGLLQDILDAIQALDPTPGDLKQFFGSGNVSAGNTSVLATYTVPSAKILFVSGLYGEGIDNGLFSLYIDGIKQWQGRNAWTERNVQSYLQYEVSSGKVVELKVTNIVNATRAYSGGFYGRQVDA